MLESIDPFVFLVGGSAIAGLAFLGCAVAAVVEAGRRRRSDIVATPVTAAIEPLRPEAYPDPELAVALPDAAALDALWDDDAAPRTPRFVPAQPVLAARRVATAAPVEVAEAAAARVEVAERAIEPTPAWSTAEAAAPREDVIDLAGERERRTAHVPVVSTRRRALRAARAHDEDAVATGRKLPIGAEAALRSIIEVVPDPRNTLALQRDPTGEVRLTSADRATARQAAQVARAARESRPA